VELAVLVVAVVPVDSAVPGEKVAKVVPERMTAVPAVMVEMVVTGEVVATVAEARVVRPSTFTRRIL
jgi:hypothetical protein